MTTAIVGLNGKPRRVRVTTLPDGTPQAKVFWHRDSCTVRCVAIRIPHATELDAWREAHTRASRDRARAKRAKRAAERAIATAERLLVEAERAMRKGARDDE